MYGEVRGERAIYENVWMHTYNTKKEINSNSLLFAWIAALGWMVFLSWSSTLFFLVADSDKKNITFYAKP